MSVAALVGACAGGGVCGGGGWWWAGGCGGIRLCVGSRQGLGCASGQQAPDRVCCAGRPDGWRAWALPPLPPRPNTLPLPPGHLLARPARRMIQSAENEVTELAKEAARADAMARAAKKAELGQAQQLELQRLKVRRGAGRGGAWDEPAAGPSGGGAAGWGHTDV